MLVNIHTLCKCVPQYIKEQHRNNVFKRIKRIPNHRICLHCITVLFNDYLDTDLLYLARK